MLENGVYVAPSQFEAMLLSTAHTEPQIKETISAARQTFKRLWTYFGKTILSPSYLFEIFWHGYVEFQEGFDDWVQGLNRTAS